MTPADEMIYYLQAVDNLERDAMLHIALKVKENETRRKKVMQLIQEAMSQLRLDMKYLIFDLEATRRERDEARGNE